MDETTMFSEEIERLRHELDLANKEESRLVMQEQRMLAFWENSKRDLEELKAQIPPLLKQKEVAAKRHQIAITLYKHKMMHVRSEQHNILFGLKADSLALSDLAQIQHTDLEFELRRELHTVQDAEKRRIINDKISLLDQHMMHRIKMNKINNTYEKKANDIIAMYNKKFNEQIETFSATCGRELFELDNDMETCAEEIMFKFEQNLQKKTAFNSRVLTLTQEHVKEIREESETAKKLVKLAKQKLAKAKDEEKHQLEVLEKVRSENKKLQADYEAFQKTKKAQLINRRRLNEQQKELHRQKVEKELLLQASIAAQQEEQKLKDYNLKKVIDDKLKLARNFLLRKKSPK